MAKVKNPLMSQEARGAVFGYVYNTWRGISYCKTNTSPTGQGTPLRLLAQARLIDAARHWATLSDAQRAAWHQYAVDHPVSDWTGSPKRLTGANWCSLTYCNLVRAGAAAIAIPPTDAAPAAVAGLTLTGGAGEVTASWTTPILGADLQLEWWATASQSKGITGRIQQAHYLQHCAVSEDQPYDVLTNIPAGRVTAFVRVVDTTTGLTSSWVSALADVT